jgi:hypothetical protein
MLKTLHERVVHSLARGDEYDLLVNASRDAEVLLTHHAAEFAAARERHVHLVDAPSRKAA